MKSLKRSLDIKFGILRLAMAKVIIGADHGGFSKKEILKKWLLDKGVDVVDVGANSMENGDDFVDYAVAAVRQFSEGDRIILFCRNGFGMCMAVNRIKGMRCGIGYDEVAVYRGRVDDDINALSIPADYVSEESMIKIVENFLRTNFSGDDKYQRRINKLDTLN